MLRDSIKMSDKPAKYYNRTAGHNHLSDMIKQKKYFPNYPIEELFDRYETAVELGLILEEVNLVKKIYHSLPVNSEQSIDHLLITDKNIYYIASYTKKMKKVHVFDKFISAEETIDKSYIGNILAKKEALAGKLSLDAEDIITVLVVDSLELTFSINVKVDMVVSLQSFTTELKNLEKYPKSRREREELMLKIEDKENWITGEWEDDDTAVLITKVSQLREKPFGETISQETNYKYKRRSKTRVKKLIFFSLLLVLLANTAHNNAELIKSRYKELSGSNLMNTGISIGGFGPQNNQVPIYEEFDDLTLCPDINNCRVGERNENNDIIFYDAGTMETWGRYLVMTDHEYTLDNITQGEFCEIGEMGSYEEYLTDYKGGEEIMHRVNNNAFMVSKCSRVAELLRSSEVGSLTANDYLIPTWDEGSKLNYYLGLLKDPGYLNPLKNNILTSSMDENGLRINKNENSSEKVTVILVRVVHE